MYPALKSGRWGSCRRPWRSDGRQRPRGVRPAEGYASAPRRIPAAFSIRLRRFPGGSSCRETAADPPLVRPPALCMTDSGGLGVTVRGSPERTRRFTAPRTRSRPRPVPRSAPDRPESGAQPPGGPVKALPLRDAAPPRPAYQTGEGGAADENLPVRRSADDEARREGLGGVRAAEERPSRARGEERIPVLRASPGLFRTGRDGGKKSKRRPHPERPRKGFGRGAAIRRLTAAGYIRAQGRQLSVGRGKPVRRQDVPREAVPFIQENFVI